MSSNSSKTSLKRYKLVNICPFLQILDCSNPQGVLAKGSQPEIMCTCLFSYSKIISSSPELCICKASILSKNYYNNYLVNCSVQAMYDSDHHHHHHYHDNNFKKSTIPVTTIGLAHTHHKQAQSQLLPSCICCPNNTTCNTGTQPTLPELLNFTCTDGRVINISVEVATKYVELGTFLLNDDGLRVRIMAHKHLNDAEQINIEVLQKWMTGRGRQPVTWTTLVEVLRDIELSVLAGDIEAVKCPAGSDSKDPSQLIHLPWSWIFLDQPHCVPIMVAEKFCQPC